MVDSEREEILAGMLADFMIEQANDSEYRAYLTGERGQAETGLGFMVPGKPSPKTIRKFIGAAFALGQAVGADTVSVSGGFPAGISIGVSFSLPKKEA